MRVRNGVDMVYVPRIARHCESEDSAFLDRCFTDAEKAYCMRLSPQLRAESFAARFAAKEAAAKALGTGICTRNIGFLSFEVSKDDSGMPMLRFRDEALAAARQLKVRSVALSLTHEKDYAIAMCTLLTDEEDTI